MSKIRLTESELISMIERVVKQAKTEKKITEQPKKKVVKLTESDLAKIVDRVMKEEQNSK